MDSNRDTLSAEEIFRLLEATTWQELTKDVQGGFSGSVTETLIGRSGEFRVELSSRYAEDGEGGAASFTYKVVVIYHGVTIGSVSDRHAPAPEKTEALHGVKALFKQHLENFRAEGVAKARADR